MREKKTTPKRGRQEAEAAAPAKKRPAYPAYCRELGTNGEGIVKNPVGKTVFVKYLLPGERGTVAAVKELKSYDIGRVETLETASLSRVEPPCPVFKSCGGCQLQHMDYAAEAAFKRELVEKTLFKVAGLAAAVRPLVLSPLAYRYRNKLSMPIRAGRDGAPVIGFFRERTHEVVPVEDCLLQPEWNRTLIALTRRYLTESGCPAYAETGARAGARHLVAREAAGRLTVTLVTAAPERLDGYFALLRGAFPAVSLYNNVNDTENNVIFGRDFRLIGETGTLADELHPAAFYQVNDSVSRRLYRDAVKLADPKDAVVVDAYSGGGLMTAMLAKSALRAYGVEIDPAAHADALRLKARERLDNMTPILGDCRDALPKILQNEAGARIVPVLDPPRKGCDAAVLHAVLRRSADIPRIVYISCNPATLARDLGILSAAYRLTLVRPYDMFPKTANVETLAALTLSRE